MKMIIKYILVVSLLLVMGSCAVTDVDRTADFAQYKTYTWGKPASQVNDPVYKSELISKNIERTIESELTKKGIVESKHNPDFIITYTTATKEKQQWRSGAYGMAGPFFIPMYRYYYWGGYGSPYSWNYASQQSTFTEGTLIIDIKDSRTKELVWRGTVKGTVDNISALEKQVQKAVKAIMKKYPGQVPEQFAPKNSPVIS